VPNLRIFILVQLQFYGENATLLRYNYNKTSINDRWKNGKLSRSLWSFFFAIFFLIHCEFIIKGHFVIRSLNCLYRGDDVIFTVFPITLWLTINLRYDLITLTLRKYKNDQKMWYTLKNFRIEIFVIEILWKKIKNIFDRIFYKKSKILW